MEVKWSLLLLAISLSSSRYLLIEIEGEKEGFPLGNRQEQNLPGKKNTSQELGNRDDENSRMLESVKEALEACDKEGKKIDWCIEHADQYLDEDDLTMIEEKANEEDIPRVHIVSKEEKDKNEDVEEGCSSDQFDVIIGLNKGYDSALKKCKEKTKEEEEEEEDTQKKDKDVFVPADPCTGEKDPKTKCPEYFTIDLDSGCYHINNYTRSYEDAVKTCERHNGHLVMIETEKEAKALQEYLNGEYLKTQTEEETEMRDEDRTSFWIGLDSLEIKNKWLWPTDEGIKDVCDEKGVNLWNNDEPEDGPNRRCAQIGHYGKNYEWYSANCKRLSKSICEPIYNKKKGDENSKDEDDKKAKKDDDGDEGAYRVPKDDLVGLVKSFGGKKDNREIISWIKICYLPCQVLSLVHGKDLGVIWIPIHSSKSRNRVVRYQYDYDCTGKMPKDAYCPKGYFELESGCYKILSKMYSSHQGKKVCHSNNGHAVEIETEKELETLVDFLIKLEDMVKNKYDFGLYHYWTGGVTVKKEFYWDENAEKVGSRCGFDGDAWKDADYDASDELECMMLRWDDKHFKVKPCNSIRLVICEPGVGLPPKPKPKPTKRPKKPDEPTKKWKRKREDTTLDPIFYDNHGDELPSMCRKEVDIECPDGYKKLKTGCYKLSKEKMTQPAARRYCYTESKDDFGYLAHINSNDEVTELNNYLDDEADDEEFWIGAINLNTGGDDSYGLKDWYWEYSMGAGIVSMLDSCHGWLDFGVDLFDDEPKHDHGCAFMQRYHILWESEECGEEKRALCEYTKDEPQ